MADDLNHRVVRFSSGAAVSVQGALGLLRHRARASSPTRAAIAVDAHGKVYVANTGNDRIDVFDKGGALLRSFGTSGRATGQFDAPLGVAADAGGVRAVTDSVNGRLELLNPDGSVAPSGARPNPGPTILPNPVAVAFDAGGNGYVLDAGAGGSSSSTARRRCRCARSARRAAARASC